MNDCCSVVLKIKRQNQTIGKMNVNRHEETVDTYKFSNFCSDMDISSYQIYKEDIVSVNAEYDKEKEIILIICRLENDMEIDFEMQP